MKNFKDVIASDNQEVFIDVNEFAEYVDVDGVLLQGQIQYRTERKSALQSETYETLHGDYLKVFFRTNDYCRKRERLPVQGEIVHVNGKRYQVLTSKDEMGITRLVVSAYRQVQLRQSPVRQSQVWGLQDV